MERENIFSVVRSLVAEEVKVDESRITEATTKDELGIESLEMATLLVGLEAEFGITLEDVALGSNPTMGEIVDLVEANIGPAT